MEQLRQRLADIDGKDYAAYQGLRGRYTYPGFQLVIDQVPKDPYAPPDTGVYRIRLSLETAGLVPADTTSPTRAVATRDYLARRFHAAASQIGRGRRGTGNSGIITIAPPTQVVLERTSVVTDPGGIELRCFLGLPASGRSITGPLAATMLFDELPAIVERSLSASALDRAHLVAHQDTVEDADALRRQLRPNGLVAFIADGSVLPRASGIDPGPLTQGAIPFRSPESLRVTLDTPHRGPVDGMGVREGITLIVGGGYHGKSTLLAAIAEGVYNHIPGDGRERCVTVLDALAVQTSPGRSVAATDISAFIGQLPDGRNPACFTSGNASGSTSQAASVSEGLEAGAGLLLLDEDASATNFLVRDARMQQLVPDDEEPITVFLDRVHQLSTEHGVSTVLVMGGSGDYFDAADQVIQLLAFSLRDVTARATEIAAALPTARRREGTAGFSFPAVRAPLADQMDPTNEHGHRSIRVPTTQRILFGRHEIDVADVPQLVEPGQSLAIGMALERVSGTFDGDCAVRTAIDGVVAEIARDGLDVLDPNRGGGLAGFRGLELAAALNRFRGLQVRQTRLNA